MGRWGDGEVGEALGSEHDVLQRRSHFPNCMKIRLITLRHSELSLKTSAYLCLEKFAQRGEPPFGFTTLLMPGNPSTASGSPHATFRCVKKKLVFGAASQRA